MPSVNKIFDLSRLFQTQCCVCIRKAIEIKPILVRLIDFTTKVEFNIVIIVVFVFSKSSKENSYIEMLYEISILQRY